MRRSIIFVLAVLMLSAGIAIGAGGTVESDKP